jgi:hypothetical protein
MTSDQLKHTLDELHKLLDDERLDAQDVAMLRGALRDINGRLGIPCDPADEADEGEEGEAMVPSATDVVDDFSARFAGEHPVLATGLRRLIDLLNQSGI